MQYHIKRWLKPIILSPATGTARDLTRSKACLITENALLRQQLIVPQRQSLMPIVEERSQTGNNIADFLVLGGLHHDYRRAA